MLSVLSGCLGVACKAKTPAITETFVDDFERVELGATWRDTSGGQFQIKDGRLSVSQGMNRPVWLQKRLPQDVEIELDVLSMSPDGDIKIELFGDGKSFDPDGNRYDPTGYVFAFGGWNNRMSIIGRLGEHDDGVKAMRRHRAHPPAGPADDGALLAGPGAPQAADAEIGVEAEADGAGAGAAPDLDGPVLPGRRYHWVITKRGGQIDWKVDGQPFLSWLDPAPLGGESHAYLGFTNWQAQVFYDNLKIRPLP